ncbi:MAG: trigger factor [Gammaproteobacteria bacterium]|jgi:trigger factor|nr:trigger factor [Gammaproteobacteria bacterium]
MQVNVEVLEGLKRKITVVLPSENIDKAVEKELQSLSGKVQLPGFRPGKIPASVIHQKYASAVRGDVLQNMLGSSWSEALEKESLKPAGMPTINILKDEAGHPVEYEALFEVYPTIELKTLDSVKVQRFKVEISDKDIDELLENLCKQHAEWHEVERAAKEGDRVVVDFDSLIEGKQFEGGSGKDVSLVLGSKSAIPGFEEAIIGAKAGDELNLNLKFPESYTHKEVIGKEAEIKITVHKVFEPELPPLDDAFAKKIGIQEDGLEGLKKQVRETMEKEVDKIVQGQVKTQVVKELLALNSIELPQVLLDEEIEKLKQEAVQQLPKNAKIDPASLSSASFEKLAAQRVATGLLFREVIRAYDIKLNQKKVEEMVLEIGASQYGDPEGALKWYRNNRDKMQMLEATVLEEQVVDALVQQVTVVEEAISYPHFMKRQAETPTASTEED